MRSTQLNFFCLLPVLLLALLAAPARAQCPVPVDFTVTNLGCTVRLNWSNTPGATAPLFWNIYRATQPNASDAAIISTVLPTIFAASDVPPVRGTTYYYFVRPLIPFGPCSSTNNDSTVLPGKLLPVPLTGLALQSQNCSAITIRWDAFPDAQSFAIYRQLTTESGAVRIDTVPAGSTSYTDTTTTPGASYFYGVIPSIPCVADPNSGGLQVTAYSAVQAGAPPLSAVRNIGDSVTFFFSFSGAVPPVNSFFGIRKDGFSIPTNPRIYYGVNQSSITITNIQPGDEGEYVSTLGNACGTATQRAVLAVRPNPCRGDFNNNGSISVEDIFDFLNHWFVGCQ